MNWNWTNLSTEIGWSTKLEQKTPVATLLGIELRWWLIIRI